MFTVWGIFLVFTKPICQTTLATAESKLTVICTLFPFSLSVQNLWSCVWVLCWDMLRCQQEASSSHPPSRYQRLLCCNNPSHTLTPNNKKRRKSLTLSKCMAVTWMNYRCLLLHGCWIFSTTGSQQKKSYWMNRMWQNKWQIIHKHTGQTSVSVWMTSK